MSTPSHLVGDERTTYRIAADRSRKSYRRRNGADGARTIAEKRAWTATHADQLATAADRGGMSAVRKMHRSRIVELDTMSDPTRVGGPAPADYLATLERHAAHSRERLAMLEPRAARKPRKPAAVVETVAPVDNTPAAVESRRAMFAGLGWSTTSTTAPADPAPVEKLRKTSKLVPCDRHASYWASLPRARRFQNACEGGTSTACDGAGCILTPGTDYYTRDLVAAGPVRVDVLNGRAPAVETPAPTYVDCDGCGTRDLVGESHTCEPREKSTSVADVVPIRDDIPTAPDTVPAPMPAMSRAARKQTRREIAAAMRAEGIRPEGEEWRRRCAAAGLPVREDVAR